MKYLAGLLFVILWINSSFAQEEQSARYNIWVFGMNIGEFSVTQKEKNGNIDIQAVTDVEVKLIVPYRVKFIQNSAYKQGSLANFHVQTLKNGKINSDTRLEREGNAYVLVKDGDSTVVNENITFSGSLLYFNEPKGISKIFKERSGEVQKIEKIADHSYLITDEKNKKAHEYSYKDGILQQAELKHPLATIYLKRVI
ncbi:DUF6134 family protein [Maribellus sp. YY47]|uniref:DUF6134 family protein n=1 Tax=Maribellus sp. YY47 TaxID=2929486 RepID=UPI002001BC32|nr:DUF6134 family protein [Maribellus sp. YY47]MCK3683143.1 hypothetical protein [Maribellus sp. YY47]